MIISRIHENEDKIIESETPDPEIPPELPGPAGVPYPMPTPNPAPAETPV